jgi:hypothetical protein
VKGSKLKAQSARQKIQNTGCKIKGVAVKIMDMKDDIFEDDNIEENGQTEVSFGESFEELLKQSEVKATFFQPGQEIETTIIQIADEWVFIDTGSKSEGVIALSEFKDEEGNITIKTGDRVRLFFIIP